MAGYAQWAVLLLGRDGLKCGPGRQRPGAPNYDGCHRRNLPLAMGGGGGGGEGKSTIGIRNFDLRRRQVRNRGRLFRYIP
jgi:hypothetical protein